MEIFHQHILMIISLTVMRKYWRFIWTEERVAKAIVQERKVLYILYCIILPFWCTRTPARLRPTGIWSPISLPSSLPNDIWSIEDTLANMQTTIIEPQELTIRWLLVHQIYLSLIHLESLWIQQLTRLDSSHPSFHPTKILSSLIKPLRSYIQKS